MNNSIHVNKLFSRYFIIVHVGREEIKYIGRVFFLNSLEEIAQRSEAKRSENVVCSRPGTKPGRLLGRPVCTMCTGTAQSTPRSTMAGKWSTGAVDQLAHGCSRLVSVDQPVDRGQGRSTGRPTDVTASPEQIRTLFLFWGRIQLGFSKSLGLSGYK